MPRSDLSSQNRPNIEPESIQNRSKIDLEDRRVPGSIQERLKKRPITTQNGQGRARDAPRALSGRPGVHQEGPGTLQERSRDAPEARLEQLRTLVKCVRVTERASGSTRIDL